MLHRSRKGNRSDGRRGPSEGERRGRSDRSLTSTSAAASGARFAEHTRDIYDADFERLACSLTYPTLSPQPTILEALTSDQRKSILRVAEMLAAKVDLPLVRVDLWLVDGEIYGSELTLTSAGGNEQFDFSTAGRLCDSLIFGMVA